MSVLQPTSHAEPQVPMAEQPLLRFRCWLLQQQACAELVKEARRSGDGQLTPAVQRALVDDAFGCASLRAAPLAPAYQRRVLQALMQAAEEDGCELADPLVELFTKAQLDGRADGEPSWRFKTFMYDTGASAGLNGTISLWCCQNMIEGSTGCHEWSAGLRMAEFCMSNAGLLKGKRCIELGCGTGVVGVAAARAGAAELLLTDGDADAVANCRRNLALNGVDLDAGSGRGEMQVTQRMWGADWSDVSAPEVLLGADLTYDKAAFPALVACISQLLTREVAAGHLPPVGYFASQVRLQETMDAFEAELAQQHLGFTVLELEPVVRFQHLLRMEELDDVRMYWIQGSSQPAFDS